MTVIAWDGTTLAADTFTSSGIRVSKIVTFEADGDAYAAAACGTSRACAQLVAWAASGGAAEAFPALASNDFDDTSMVVVRLRDGLSTRFDGVSDGYTLRSPRWAMGSGEQAAMGAMAAGADAVRAAHIACELDTHCSAPVEHVTAGMSVAVAAPARETMSEDLRIRADASSIIVGHDVAIDGVVEPMAIWADERTGEAAVALLRDGEQYVASGAATIATEVRRGHVQFLGVPDDLRRRHLAGEKPFD